MTRPRPHTAPLAGLALLVLVAALLGAAAQPAAAQSQLWINELHYDNAGGDVGEFVEVAGPAGTDLSGYSLVLYNGSGGSSYDTESLSGVLPDEGNGFGAAAFTPGSIQNGSPDGIALVQGGTVVQFLSYEGAFTASNGPASGMTSTDIGVSEASNSPEGHSLQLTGEGTSYPDFTWSPPSAESPGALNTGQVVGTPVPTFAINEIRIDQPSGDVDEYAEIHGAPGASLDGLTYLVIGDGSGGSGVIEAVVDLTGNAVPATGLFVMAESTFSLGTADLITSLNFENSDNVTHVLVEGFTGADGQDLDTNDDGTLDVEPWTTWVDSVALVETPGSGEQVYGPVAVGPDGSFVPGHVYACPDGGDTYEIGDFGAGTDDTPGALNCDDDPGDPGDGDPVLISEVQGSGPASPLDGQTVEVSGVLTARFEDNDTLDAFFLQEEDADADADPATSEGVFVFCRGFCPVELAVGDHVTVTGVVDEYYGMTQLAPASAADITIVSSGNPLPTPAQIALPAAGPTNAEATFEAVEGMVVEFPSTLAVSEYFELARYGQIVLTEGSRPYQFTHDNAPSATGYAAFLDDLASRRIILDDDDNDQNESTTGAVDEAYPFPSPAWPTGGLALDNLVRGGDTITGLTGVMHWSFAGQSGTDAWRVRPIDGLAYTFDPATTRTAAPEPVGGDLTVASFNVLNYFETVDVTSSNSSGHCGPSGTMDCRGADSPAELQRQQDKIVAALAAIDADVVGLIEIENSPTAVQHLVDGLNAVVGAGTYAQVDTGTIGTDAIKVGFIYKPATVTATGAHAILDSSVDPRFVDSKNRPVLAQTFTQNATGGSFTAAVNHLKSKGSDCSDIGEDESVVDGQGNCSQTRADAAAALADWLAADPTGSGDTDALILGDLNAYKMEDAITTLEAAGYTDLAEAFVGPDAYSYVFDGQLGYLDYAMGNAAMTSQVTGVTEWHINADEVPLLDYNDAVGDTGEASFERESDALPIYAPDAYRASDHDPVVVGLDLAEDPAPVADAGGPYEVRVNGTVTLDATASVDNSGDGLTFAWDFDGDGLFDDATGPTPTFEGRGKGVGPRQVTVQVTDGNGVIATATATVDVLSNGNGNGGRPPGHYGRPGRG